MSCLEVRDRLPEFVLGVLPRPQGREVERHLAWCAGCSKEADELFEGAASVGLSVPLADPAPSLELRVTDRVRGVRPPRRSGSRRGFRLLVVATAAALLMAMGAVAWGVRETDRQANLRSQFNATIDRLSALVSGAGSRQAKLVPTSVTADEGTAVVYSSPRSADLVFVDIFPARPNAGPYRFKLYGASGKVISGGQLRRTTNGDWLFYEFSGLDLSKAVTATVFDGRGNAILTGRLRQSSSR